jgi:hypothetical protein
MNGYTPRQRRWLRGLLGLFVLSLVALIATHAPRGITVNILPLELADTAVAFKTLVERDWMPSDTPAGVAPRFWRLRGNLFADSVLFVPAYVGLLLFFTLAFGPPAALQPSRRQLLCVPAVAAGLFDIAENGMTGRALDDLIELALVDATTADVSLAARIKWVLLGVALLLLAWRVFANAAPERPWRALAAVLCAGAGLAFAAGGAASWQMAIGTGLPLALGGLGLLAWRALRAPPLS